MPGVEWLLIPLAVVLVVAIVVVVLQGRRREAGPRTPADPLADGPGGPLQGLGIGALVRHEERDWLVRGEVRFDEDGYVWSEYHLDDVDLRRWLSVDLGDGTDVSLWEALETDLGLDPGRTTELEAEGERWIRVEHGHARYTATGTTGLPDAGRAEYADFRHAEDRDRLLAFERWSADGSWEVSRGRRLPVEALDVYPAGHAAGGTA